MRNEIVNNRKNVLDDSLCVSLIKTAEEKLLFLRKDSINKYLIKNKVGKINQNKIYYSILEKINEKMQYFMHMEINFENFPLNIASFDITQFVIKNTLISLHLLLIGF